MLTETTANAAAPAPANAPETAVRPRRSHRAPGGGVVTVLVPAHNESAGITETLLSLNNQTQRPDRVIVVADNCTDDTEELALAQAPKSCAPWATKTRRPVP